MEGSDEEQACKPGLPSILRALSSQRKELRRGTKGEADGSDEAAASELTDLEKRIVRQVEFYFGDHNLPRDRFMKEVMEDNGGWMAMETMLTFKRLSDLSRDEREIATALGKSPNRIVEVDFAGRRMRRHPGNPLPDFDEAARLEVQQRTVYVGGFPRDGITLDDMLLFFEGGYAGVANVMMRFKREPQDSSPGRPPDRPFLGSAFVTFRTHEAANDFVRDGGSLRFQGRRLKVKFQKEFFEQRIEDNDAFAPDEMGRTVCVHGFDDADTDEDRLAAFFELTTAATAKRRLFRDHSSKESSEGEWRFGGTAIAVFETDDAARSFVRTHAKVPLTYRGDRLRIQWLVDFYEEKGKFRKEVLKWKEQKNSVQF